jgi:cysteine dioxygenase type I
MDIRADVTGTMNPVKTIEEPLFVPVLPSLDGLVEHDGLLSTDELEELARTIATQRDIWEPLVHADAERRRYELVYEDDRMDAWILSWMPGQGTGFHDHYISGVGLCVASGTVREDLLVYGADPQTRILGAGDSRQGGPGYIHRVNHDSGLPAVTVHVYSPRLDWVGQYRLGHDGVIRREVRPGRNELTEQLVAEGALEHVLERF